MSTYEPGTVAVATVRGVPHVRVMRRDTLTWLSPVAVEGLYGHENDHVTDIRPLVVLDHSHITDAVNGLGSALHDFEWANDDERHAIKELRDTIEAQTTPPRIPEPGLWGVVEANRRELDGRTDLATGTWVRVEAAVCRWQHTSGTWTANWDDLIDPTLIRPGIEDEQ